MKVYWKRGKIQPEQRWEEKIEEREREQEQVKERGEGEGEGEEEEEGQEKEQRDGEEVLWSGLFPWA